MASRTESQAERVDNE